MLQQIVIVDWQGPGFASLTGLPKAHGERECAAWWLTVNQMPGTQNLQATLTAVRGVQPQMTLDEWEKIQKEKRAARAKEGRQPKEITNKEDFSGMQEFTRKDRTADTNVLNVTQKQLSARKAGTNERERKTAVSAFTPNPKP